MVEPRCGPQKPLSLAIVGGGIAGLTLCIALLKQCSSMTITVYESASSFGEIGAGVGFQPVMVRTMSLIDPRITAAFEKCNKGNTATEPPIWFTVRVGDKKKYDSKKGDQCMPDMVEERRETGLGEDTGLEDETFIIPARRGPGGGVHRAHFLDELIKLIPDGVAQFHKRLINATEATDGSGLYTHSIVTTI
jgi:salicylate hydroxylase